MGQKERNMRRGHSLFLWMDGYWRIWREVDIVGFWGKILRISTLFITRLPRISIFQHFGPRHGDWSAIHHREFCDNWANVACFVSAVIMHLGSDLGRGWLGHGESASSGEVGNLRNGYVYERYETSTDAATAVIIIGYSPLSPFTLLKRGLTMANLDSIVVCEPHTCFSPWEISEAFKRENMD